MGFYLRKSFRAGPLRLNLSKGGLGFSVGVTGARVGVASNGRAYVHAGRGGLYYKEYLTGRQGRRATATSLSSGSITESIDTGTTFPRPETPGAAHPSLAKTLVRPKLAVAAYLWLLVTGLLGLMKIGANADSGSRANPVLVVLTTALLVLWPFPMTRAFIRNRRAARLGTRLESELTSTLAPTAERDLWQALANRSITPSDRAYQCKMAYLHLLTFVVSDGEVGRRDLVLLDQATKLLSLDADFVREARLDVVRNVYLAVVEDHDLTQDEDRALTQISTALGVVEDQMFPEFQFVEHLREIRRIHEGDLPEISCTKPLQAGEVCYLEAPGRILKDKTLRSFQRDGQRHTIRGLVADKEGTLLLTNKRLVLVHDGVTTIPWTKVLEVRLEYDRNLLSISKDGVTTPVYLSTPDAHRASAIVSRLARL